MLSIIIPTLNSAKSLPTTISALESGRDSGLVDEVLISDGGSQDDTINLARDLNIDAVIGPPGRGAQLQRGALKARGDWYLFLHSDTTLEEKWLYAVEEFICQGHNGERAAAFRFVLDDDDPKARRLENVVAWRCAKFGLPYGDQGLLLSRQFYRQVGGYRDLPLMEDVDMVRRIGRRRLHMLPIAARTSAVRYQLEGYWRRPTRNLLCLGLYYLGLSPKQIAKVYE